MRYSLHIVTALTLSALVFTEAGETSDPQLSVADLPAEIANACPMSGLGAECANHRVQWIGRTARGHLFLVERSGCVAHECSAWLVSRERGAARTLLAVSGEYRLEFGDSRYPRVDTRMELSTNRTAYGRFEWNGEKYVRAEMRVVHRVDGFECADISVCEAAALDALRNQQAERAVRIWQEVHGVNWI